MEAQSSHRFFLPFLVMAAIGFGVPHELFAAEISAEFRGGYSTTDNVARTSSGEIDDQTVFVGASLSFLDQNAKSIVDIRANFDYLDYLDDSFDSRILGGFDGRARFFFLDERVSWIVSDNFGQRMLDPLAQPDPGNEEDINYFSTGPTLRIPIGARNYLRLGAMYSVVTLEESSQFDNDRLMLQTQIGRNIRSDTTLSLNVDSEETRFDNGGLSSDFEVLDSYIRYAVLSARNDLSFDLGFTRLKTDSGETGDGFLLRADWTRFVSASTSFAAGAGSRYSDQGDVFEFTQDISTQVGDIADVDGTDAPFRSNYVYTRYNKNSPRSQLVFEARMIQDDYEFGAGRDRDLIFGNLSLTRDFTSSTFGTIAARVSQRDYKYLNQVDDQIDLTVTFGFRFSRNFDVRVSYQRSDRDSNVQFQGYTENRGVIQFTYTPPWAQRTEAER